MVQKNYERLLYFYITISIIYISTHLSPTIHLDHFSYHSAPRIFIPLITSQVCLFGDFISIRSHNMYSLGSCFLALRYDYKIHLYYT